MYTHNGSKCIYVYTHNESRRVIVGGNGHWAVYKYMYTYIHNIYMYTHNESICIYICIHTQ